MGHSKASKANTRARLVEAAAARFKERGIDGISLADLMKDLQLTHGGFYKHFGSRDELVTEALALALTKTGQVMRERLYTDGKADVGAFLDFYLNEAHRDERATGCAVAALAGDAARKNADVQSRFREGIEANLESLSEALTARAGATEAGTAGTVGTVGTVGGGTSAAGDTESRATALLVLSALYGALIMARAVGDSPLSSEILRTVRKRVLLGSSPADAPTERQRKRASGRKAKPAKDRGWTRDELHKRRQSG
jgi:TetR/AcrR family transcriptional regulator, transcriptional repressor for nem operon